jgi:putative N6-adenine-specific DNA methylase
MSNTVYRIFCVCAPGLEPWLAQEIADLTKLRVKKIKAEGGGVSFAGDLEKLKSVLRNGRLAEGVRVRLGPAKDVTTFQGLHEHFRKLPWAAYLLPKRGLPPIRVVAHKSRLYHSDAVKERAEIFLRNYLKLEKDSKTDLELPTVHLRFDHDRLQVSVDAAGEEYYKRGYRLAIGRAPLRETIAAALLRMASFEKVNYLWDPFCGSGTIPLEASSLTCGLEPRSQRKFAFQAWPSLGQLETQMAPDESLVALSETLPAGGLRIMGSDRDEQALAAAQENSKYFAKLFGVPALKWRQGDFEEVEGDIPAGAIVVCNPPYGLRMGKKKDLGDLYRRFGAMLKRRSDLQAVVLTAFEEFEAATAIPWNHQARINNRGVVANIWKHSAK